MSTLRDIIELLTVSPGDLAYHLIALFAIQIILAITVGHWSRRKRDASSTRMLIMGSGIFLTRLLLMTVALLDRVGLISSGAFVPPLERALNLITPFLVAWAFLPLPQENSRISIGLLAIGLVMVASAYGLSTFFWQRNVPADVAYNSYWQHDVWQATSIAFLALALAATLVWRIEDWTLLGFLFLLWLAGHIMQLTQPFPSSNSAGWIRLANLVAFPLLTTLVYRQALRGASGDDGGKAVALTEAFENIRRVEGASDTAVALKMVTSAIARALDTDMVAIGLSTEGKEPRVEIVALHPPTTATMMDEALYLEVIDQPLLAAALQAGETQRVTIPQEPSQVGALYQRLGFEQIGPLLVSPLNARQQTVGVLLIGNPISKQRLSAQQEKIAHALTTAVSASLANMRRREAPEANADLRKALSEAHALAQRAAELESELEQREQEARELATKLELREQDHKQALSTVSIWQEEVQEIAAARDALEAQADEWREKAKHLAALHSDLKKKLARSQGRMRKLRAENEALQSNHQNTGIILVADEEGQIILASQKVQNLTGRARSTLLGAPIKDLFPDPDWQQAVADLLSDQQSDTLVNLALDEGMIRAELSRLPQNPHWPGALTVILYPEEDIWSSNEVVVSLIQELRTPMTSITGYTDMLLNESAGILGEMQRQFLQRVQANIERMDKLLEDLIKVTAIDTGQVSLSPEPIHIEQVIHRAVEALTAEIEGRELSVKLEIPPELPPMEADREALYQIVVNLLSNAVRCSRAGTEVVLRSGVEGGDGPVEQASDYLFVSVTDTGGGIAPEEQSRVFQRFYRAQNPLITGLGETGVGLSIAKTLAEAQNGRLWVESEIGVGSTFIFILPLSHAPETPTGKEDGK